MSLPLRLTWSLSALAMAALLLLMAHAASRACFFPQIGPGHGLLAQRHADARLGGVPGPAYLESRTSMSDQADPDFQAQNFSLRLTGYFTVLWPGSYRIAVESDDDSRLFVDGTKVVDNSGEHSMRPAEAKVWLGVGRHLYEVEYAQRVGGAGLRLLWALPWGSLKTMSPDRLHPAIRPVSREQAEAWGTRAWLACVPMTALIFTGLAVALARLWLKNHDQPWHLALACLFLATAMWMNSGTLAPLAACQPKPNVYAYPGDCYYLGSIDSQHFEATHWMLDGDPVRKWSFSLVLRRILLPLAAHPFMKLWGFLEGGFLANLVAHLAMLISWAVFTRRRVGARGALWALYGLALYPGLYYWSSLPYSYAFIVPGSVWAFMALTRLGQADGLGAVLIFSGLLGVLFLGYDLWPFYLPAALLLVWWRTRRLGLVAAALPGLVLPTAAMIVLLSLLGAYTAPVEQGHEPLAVFRSFLGQIDLAAWWRLMEGAPLALAQSFFFGNYVFLPGLFLLVYAAGRGRWGVRLCSAEVCLLLALLGVFLFNNLAPPYKGWQFRGDMYVRFYQPALAVFLFYTARVMQAVPTRSWVVWPALASLVLSAYVTYGAPLGLPAADYLHWRFGGDGSEYGKNLAKHGRRPLGLCPPFQGGAEPASQPRR